MTIDREASKCTMMSLGAASSAQMPAAELGFKGRILRTFARGDLVRLCEGMHFLPLKFNDQDLEAQYAHHVHRGYRPRLHLSGLVVSITAIAIWLTVGIGFKSFQVYFVPKEIEYAFNLHQGVVVLLALTVILIPHLPVLSRAPELVFYWLVSAMFTSHATLMMYSMYSMPVNIDITSAFMWDFSLIHNLMLCFIRLKFWGDTTGLVLYVGCLIGINLFCQSRIKYSWTVNLWAYLMINIPLWFQAVKFNPVYEYETTFVLQQILTTSIVFLSFCGRCHRELQERVEFFQHVRTMQKLKEIRDEIARKKKEKCSTGIDDLITMLRRSENLVETVVTETRHSSLAEAFHILRECLDLLARTENLYTVKLSRGANDNDQMIEILEAITEDHSRPSRTVNFVKEKAAAGTGGGLTKFSLGRILHGNRRKDDKVYTPKCRLTSWLIPVVGRQWLLDTLSVEKQTRRILLEVGSALLVHKAVDLGTTEDTILHFLAALEEQYFRNPYHNATHAAMVAHTSFTLARYLGFCENETFECADKISLVVAALAHDVGHPGRNNAFFVSTYDPVAIIYNDRSVLENYHCAITFHLLTLPSHNIFDAMPTEALRSTRNRIVDLILATDMKLHFESLARMRVRKSANDFNYFENEEDYGNVLKMCIKAGDLSHAAVDWVQHLNWSLRVVEEFYQQGDNEERLGLPKSRLCDRDHHASFASSQKGFIQFVVQPLFKELEEISPAEVLKDECGQRITQNLTHWSSLVDKSETVELLAFDPQDSAASLARMPQIHVKLAGSSAPAREQREASEVVSQRSLFTFRSQDIYGPLTARGGGGMSQPTGGAGVEMSSELRTQLSITSSGGGDGRSYASSSRLPVVGGHGCSSRRGSAASNSTAHGVETNFLKKFRRRKAPTLTERSEETQLTDRQHPAPPRTETRETEKDSAADEADDEHTTCTDDEDTHNNAA